MTRPTREQLTREIEATIRTSLPLRRPPSTIAVLVVELLEQYGLAGAVVSKGRQSGTEQLREFTLTGVFDPPVELPVPGPGLVTFDGRMLRWSSRPEWGR